MKLHSSYITTTWYFLILLAVCSFTSNSEQLGVSNFTLKTNQQYIESLQQNSFDVNDTISVIKKILSNLPDENMVYPSEGYFYFGFVTNGKVYQGNLGFFIGENDSFNFSISEKATPLHQHYSNHLFSKTIKESDGFKIKTSQNEIQIRYGNAKKKFTLFNDFKNDFSPCLNEEFLGTCFDESGIRFQLVFNQDSRSLYYVLDDTTPHHLQNYQLDIYYDPRTQFAFFKDEICDRFILIGVQQLNVKMNNWFDGPFDQLPDREFLHKKINLKKYLDPSFQNEVDSLGIYISNRNNRVAICNYTEYNELIQLLKIRNECLAKSPSYDEFISSLTTPRITKSTDNL